MKKLLIGCAFVASAFAIHAAGTDTSKAMCERVNSANIGIADTLPKKDTTRKDSLQYQSLAYAAFDTLPKKKDTTKKDTMFSSAVAYRLISDTLPHRDTTKKDTSFQAFAFNR